MLSPTGCGDPVFECASPSNPLQTRRSAAIEAKRLETESHRVLETAAMRAASAKKKKLAAERQMALEAQAAADLERRLLAAQ